MLLLFCFIHWNSPKNYFDQIGNNKNTHYQCAVLTAHMNNARMPIGLDGRDYWKKRQDKTNVKTNLWINKFEWNPKEFFSFVFSFLANVYFLFFILSGIFVFFFIFEYLLPKGAREKFGFFFVFAIRYGWDRVIVNNKKNYLMWFQCDRSMISRRNRKLSNLDIWMPTKRMIDKIQQVLIRMLCLIITCCTTGTYIYILYVLRNSLIIIRRQTVCVRQMNDLWIICHV